MRLVSLAIVFGALALPVLAAPAKKVPPRKPAPKKPAVKAGGPVVLGTKQLPGDFGKLGTTYTIGRSAPLNFTLKSAEYSISRVTIDNSTTVPKADQKLLVLHYTIHNPLPREQRYYWAEVTFTAVDSKDVNHGFVQAVGREGTNDKLELSLKPAQKVEAWTAIAVPAEGVVPKLIVKREDNAPVIRYDLRGKVAPLPAPFADPNDSTGSTVAKPVPIAAGQVAPIGVFDAKLETTAYTTEELLLRAPEEGKRYLTATFILKNTTRLPARYYWGDFVAEVRDVDGEKTPYVQGLLKASRNEQAQGNLEPGEEVRVRFYFSLPEKVAAKTVLLKECARVQDEEARAFAFDVSGGG